MWRKVLKWKHVSAQQRNDGVGRRSANQFGKGLNNGQEFVCRLVITSDKNERTIQNPLQFRNQQRLGWRVRSGYTNTSRVCSEVGDNTRKRGKLFDVRK